ncbi:alpha-E domain-containing protein [Roseomonas sp. SSH11]|uniref:Alpha-E domain-containing protein n=1 Tax=Pararoseomonas baculiformis TaxID=2820812 RepID=A0ABS4AH79_9PROT|nr:alpha-E domain-containing protein [Pararoseomonas baculiformis]MBP0446224.1 alpha-E domain-containing protein [Pararoseomonas baculiformis]
MLARTADSLFWLGRYMERAGNVARGLNATLRMASLAAPRGTETAEWAGFLDATGTRGHYQELYGDPTPDQAARWLTLDTLNLSSIASCFESARRNARAVRTALTVDMWEAVNDTWIDLRKLDPGEAGGDRLMGFNDWVMARTVLFNGAAMDTMLRDDAWRFVRLGVMLERADNTARLLASRISAFGVAADEDASNHAQWQALLRSVAALRAYQHLFRERLRAARVVELLLMRPEHPRSVSACYEEVNDILGVLAMSDGEDRVACRRLAAALRGRCVEHTPARLMDGGLKTVIDEIIAGNGRLGASIGKCFLIG